MIVLTPRWLRALRVAAFAIVSVAIIVALRGIDWTRTTDALRQARPSWLVVAVVANSAIIAAWSAFWRSLVPANEPRVSYRRMFDICATASSLMNSLPFGGGHASSVVLLVRRAGLSNRGALSVLALDQLGEGITKVAIFLLAALLVPIPLWMRASVAIASIAVGVWLVVLLVASRWAAELGIVKSLARSTTALAWVGATKVAEAVAIIAVARAYGVDLTIGSTLLVLAATILASMLPVSPGNLGTYEAGVFLAYRHLGVPAEQALSIAVMQHVCFMLPAVGVGYLFFSAQTFGRRAIASR